MADFMQNLPPEYADEIQRILRQRAMAEALGGRAFAERPTEMVSGRAIPQGGIGGIARALTGFIGQGQIADSDAALSGAQGRLADSRQREMRGTIAELLTSRDPVVRAYGLEQQKRKQEAAKAAGVALTAGGDIAGAVRTIGSEEIPQDYQAPARKAPVFGSVPGVNGQPPISTVVNTDKFGIETGAMHNGVNIKTSATAQGGNAALPGQKAGFEAWAKAAVEDNQKMGASARAAGDLVNTINQMSTLDANGLISGPAAPAAVFVEGLAKQAGMKIDTAQLANSQTFNSIAQEAVQQLIGQYGGNRGVTKEEAAQIAQSLPQLQQSPEARKTLSQIIVNVAKRKQSQYQLSRAALNDALKTEDMTKYEFGDVQVPTMPPVVPVPGLPRAPAKPIKGQGFTITPYPGD